MIGCLRTRVRKQPIIAIYFESEIVLKFYNLEAWLSIQLYCKTKSNLTSWASLAAIIYPVALVWRTIADFLFVKHV